ncbi:MAG: nucleotidyl transferase AbiEii/AbiGii toxin family protein [Deltaproteobacteria bacterium]|nr:nucleotidyl transferase AbiEii/AbiGii toxin family protein [Deltaproteobacteria bacterium]
MKRLSPNLAALPKPQQRLWPELAQIPGYFTLYGGTALALRLGHRTSVDFDFFTNRGFDPQRLQHDITFLRNAETVQMEPHTLTCRVERDGPVLVSFFGDLGLGLVEEPDLAEGNHLRVASLLDLAGTKAAVVQKRAEAKDYLDFAALLAHGIDLPTALAAGKVVYGRSFNPVITLKALSYFDDVPQVPVEVRERLSAAVAAVDLAGLPLLKPFAPRAGDAEA